MNSLRLVSPILMWIIVMLGSAVLWQTVPDQAVLDLRAARWAVLCAGVVYWLLLFIGGGSVNRQAPRSAARIHKVLKDGVYAHVRHPIYSADIFLAWCAALFYGQATGLAIALWLTVVLIAWMRLEEKALVIRFGSQYLDYQKTTPMLIPRLRGRKPPEL